METASPRQVIIPGVATSDKKVRWFSDSGCVVHQPDAVEVFIDGTLIGVYEPADKSVRDLLLVGLAQDRRIKKGKLAQAFGITAERLRLIRKEVDTQGLEAIYRRSRETRGRKSVVTPALRRQLVRLFDEGFNAAQAYIERGKEAGLSYRTVCRVQQSWMARKAGSPVQLALADGKTGRPIDERPALTPDRQEPRHAQSDAIVKSKPRCGRHVQHVGGWLLVAMVHALGLHAAILQRWNVGKAMLERLRVVVDAVIVALGLGQRCVEGVRRLRTETGGVLLRAPDVPTESWSRRVLKQYVEETSPFWLQMSMMQVYLARSRADQQHPAVFYVDNHMRPYTGKYTTRKGWRMQDKRARPGATDYYVHDEDGRPVYRLDVPSNDSLTTWLSPLTRFLRASLGDEQRILVAFDRAGAFPEQMMRLRQSGIEFVTYERRPYPLLSSSAFGEQVVIHKDNGHEPEVIGVHESRNKNLRKGRGRVRRIALKMTDGHQVNLLAASDEPKERLIEVMLGRWLQENGFKHGNERWGINQLDRRKLEPYDPETIIPNPARRRLDHALRLAREREGEARRKLARLEPSDPKRSKAERDLKASIAQQQELEAQRPHVPKRAPLKETELSGKLVYHPGEYKTLLDTIRIAAANAESELAATLAPHLRRPREAKKALANIFAAPGDVRVNRKSITVSLAPAGTSEEQRAFQQMLSSVNSWHLTLPGDPKRRPLRFRSQVS